MQWHLVAQELGTNRSAVECARRYVRQLQPQQEQFPQGKGTKQEWDAAEEACLTAAVSKHGTNWKVHLLC